jgi:hypothetical protein
LPEEGRAGEPALPGTSLVAAQDQPLCPQEPELSGKCNCPAIALLLHESRDFDGGDYYLSSQMTLRVSLGLSRDANYALPR